MTTQGAGGGAPPPAATAAGAPASKPKSSGGLFGLGDAYAAAKEKGSQLAAAAKAVGDASNTTNKGELIVTATFPFVADTIVASDILKVEPGSEAVKNHRNYISCDKAPPDQTTTHKTLCRGERIVHEMTNIGDPFGPPSINDDFDGEGGGINNNGQYKKNAHPVAGSCSPDCDVEGKPVVRHHDPSKQNADNTDGLFVHTGLDNKNPPLDKLKARRCTVENLTAKCRKGREATNSRLEVLEGNFVTVLFDWVNAATTDPNARKFPKCQLPKNEKVKHSRYQVFRKEHNLVTNSYDKNEKLSNGKGLVLTEEWVGNEEKGENPVGADGGSGKKFKGEIRYDEKGNVLPKEKGGPLESAERQRRPDPAIQTNARTQAVVEARNPSATQDQAAYDARQAHGRDIVATRERDKQFGMQQAERIQRAQDVDKLAGKFSKIAGNVHTIFNLVEFARAWNVKPMEIRFEAQGCAGAQLVTIGVMPRATWAINVFELKEIVDTLTTLKETMQIISSYLGKIKDMQFDFVFFDFREIDKGGKKEQVQLVLFNKAKLAFAFEYRELERDSDPGKKEIAGRKKNQVHRAWRVEAGIGTVVGVAISYRFPIARFAPCLGELGVLLLRLSGIEIAIQIKVDLGCGIAGEFGMDEYGLLYQKPVEITPSAVFSIGLVFEAGEFAKASADVVGSAKFKFTADANNEGSFVVRKQSVLRLDLVWKAEINLFGWKRGTGDTYALIDPVVIPETRFPVMTYGS